MYIRVIFTLLGLVQCELLDLTCEDIIKIVDGHNIRRVMLAKGLVLEQPPAFHMMYLVWDTELASKAAEWASENVYGPNPNKKIDSGRFKVGENIFQYSTTDPSYEFDFNSAMENWYDEHKNYTYGPLKRSDFQPDQTRQIGHYTQMVWANTTYIGCAVSKYTELKWIRFFIVCNYGPTGNYIGQVPYKKGKGNGRLLCKAKDCLRMYGPSC